METVQELARQKRVLDSIAFHLLQEEINSMGLAEVMLEIAQEMEEYDSSDAAVASWAKQIRRAVKASEYKQTLPPTAVLPREPDTSLNWNTITKREEAKRLEREREEQQRKANFQEGWAPVMVVCCGGKSDGLMVPWDNKAPEGAKTIVDGETYIYTGGNLVIFTPVSS